MAQKSPYSCHLGAAVFFDEAFTNDGIAMRENGISDSIEGRPFILLHVPRNLHLIVDVAQNTAPADDLSKSIKEGRSIRLLLHLVPNAIERWNSTYIETYRVAISERECEATYT